MFGLYANRSPNVSISCSAAEFCTRDYIALEMWKSLHSIDMTGLRALEEEAHLAFASNDLKRTL